MRTSDQNPKTLAAIVTAAEHETHKLNRFTRTKVPASETRRARLVLPGGEYQ
jgi:hypothetical protein